MRLRQKIPSTKSYGFTLIELMVVVTIIGLLASLIVPALQGAQTKAMSMKCIATGRAIGTAIRTYSSSFGGWTNPDPDSFVKEFGFKLRTDLGYFGEAGLTSSSAGWAGDATSSSYTHASVIRDFVCPVDSGPRATAHVIPTSYTPTGLFAGENLMAPSMDASTMLAVKENGKRHILDGTAQSHFVFADLHASLGYDGPALPGLIFRDWNLSTSSGIKAAPQSDLPDAVNEQIYSSALTFPIHWSRNLIGMLDESQGVPNDWSQEYSTSASYTYLYRIVRRGDGMLKFPEAGDWEFRVDGTYYAAVSFGIGSPMSPGDAYDNTTFAWTEKPRNGYDYSVATWGAPVTVSSATEMYPIQIIYDSVSYQGNFGVRWRRVESPGQYDTTYGGATGVVLPANSLFYAP